MLHSIRSPLDGFASPFGPRRRPSWVPERSLWAFRGDDYWREGRRVSLSALMAESRSGTALALMADGSYQSFAANTPIIRPVLGLDGYGSYTQYFLNEAAPVNQTITLPATGSYTLHVQGAGSAAVAAGTATISNAGSADASAPRTIGCSATGTVNVTITGSPTRVWFTNTAFPVPPVTTAGSPVTRAASNLTVVDPTSLGITRPRFVADVNIDRLSASAARTLYAAGVDANQNIDVYFDTDNRVKARLRKLGPELLTGAATNVGSWTHSGLTVTAPGSVGADRVEWTLASGTGTGRQFLVSCPNTMPSLGFFLDFGTGTGSQAGNLDSGTSSVIMTTTANGTILRVGRWSGSPTGTIGPLSVREIITHYTLQSGVIGSTGIRRVEVNFSPGANSLSVEGVTGDSNTDATALPTLTTWRLLNGLGGTTPWNGNVPLISLGQAA